MEKLAKEQTFFSYYMKKLQNIIVNNYKIILSSIITILLLIGLYQYFIFYQNNKILKASITYNEAKSLDSEEEFYLTIKSLLNENNFYSLLSMLEINKKILLEGDLEKAYKNYLKLLEKKDLNNLYKSTISIHGSYLFLDQININNKTKIIEKVRFLISNIDDELLSYQGLKLEILYLLSIVENNDLNNEEIHNETHMIYEKIMNKDSISPSIKDRVNKIHEFQKYN